MDDPVPRCYPAAKPAAPATTPAAEPAAPTAVPAAEPTVQPAPGSACRAKGRVCTTF